MENTAHHKWKPRATAVKTEADFPAVGVVCVYPQKTFRLNVFASTADHCVLFN